MKTIPYPEYIPLKNDSTHNVLITNGVPEQVRDLLWRVFFSSRGRGISLPAHFPWIDNATDVFSIFIEAPALDSKKAIVAALVVKRMHLETGRSYGMIGLVAVAEAWRGNGLSSRLMEEAIAFSKTIKIEALVLWTQKPGVYTRHGFISDGQECFGQAHRQGVEAVSSDESIIKTPWPDTMSKAREQGIPAFAVDGQLCSNGVAEAIVLRSLNGSVTLAGWQGAHANVADLLVAVMPER
ncbi:hypothetical protein D9M71_199370 [compost metagenome]